jgi:exopolysaccharide biosynthesis polyprenyl glycosylphosphotransferase
VAATDTAPSVKVPSEKTTVVLPRALPRPTALTGPARWVWESRYARRLIALDVFVALAGAITALQLQVGPDTSLPNQVAGLIGFPLVWVLTLAVSRAYEGRFLFAGNDEYQRVFRGAVGLVATVAIWAYAVNTQFTRRYVIIAVPIAVLLTIIGRYFMRQRLHASWGRGQRLRRVILIGHGPAVMQLTRQLGRERFHGLGVVGACLPANSPMHRERPRDGAPPIYGTFDDVAAAVRYARADTVLVLSCPELDGPTLRRMAWQLENDKIDLIVASTLVDVAGDRTTIRPVDGLPLLHVEHPKLRGVRRVIKDIFDRVGALLGIIAISPLLLVIAALVKFGSGGGPALFRQVRVGKDGQQFNIFKFRTMYTDAEARLAEVMHLNEHDGALFKMRNDPRITPVGRWLRRFSMDELPQLFNVALGHMSLVGPRPPLPAEVAKYPADMRRRLVVKPGMTGLWQVSGRSDLSWEESIRLDLRYVENWSLTMDLVILARTLTAVARVSGAY